MLGKLRTFVVITLFAVLVWLFAEAESLGTAALPEITVRINSASAERLVTTPRDWRSRVSVELRGSRQAIEDARAVLSQGLQLAPGMPGVPDGSGTVDLLVCVRGVEAISETGVEVISVTPIRTEITVTELVTVEAPIDVRLQGVSPSGDVRVTPPTARVRLPEAQAEELGDSLMVSWDPDAGALESIPDRGAAALSGRLSLPRSLAGASILEPNPPVARVEFAVLSTTITARIDIVPVQVSMPSIELNDWRVQLSADNASISTSITGPRSIVNEIADESTGRRLVAILYLRSDELNLRITSKAITFALVTGDGTITALPSSVTVEPSADAVQFTVTRMEQPGSGVDG